MKTDPRKSCTNQCERFLWAFVHDLFAHGAMTLSFWSNWLLKFHDWTSHRAWPRDADRSGRASFKSRGKEFIGHPAIGRYEAEELSPGIWRVWHPNVNHAITTTAEDGQKAFGKAYIWFRELSTEFGGNFELK